MKSAIEELAFMALGSKDPAMVIKAVEVMNVIAGGVRLTSSNVLVDTSYFWQPMSTLESKSAKAQLYTPHGVSIYGAAVHLPDAVAWAPLPKILPWLKELVARP